MDGMEPTLEITGRVATITLRRPDSANRLGDTDLDMLSRHIAQVNDCGAAVLRIRASGRYFCAGYDLRAMHDSQGAGADTFGQAMDALEAARPVTIALVDGGAYGGGTDLCLACDFRLGTPASHMQMTALKFGIHLYQGGLERYVSRLGLDAAKRLLLTAEKIEAPAMLSLGFLSEIVAQDALQARADELSAVLAGMSPEALFSTKKHLNAIARGGLDPDMLHADIQRVHASADTRRRLLGWQERRGAVLRGAQGAGR